MNETDPIVEIDPRFMAGYPPNILLNPDIRAWVAGGAIRRWFLGQPQTSDIDLFASFDRDMAAALELNGLDTDRPMGAKVQNFPGSPIQAIWDPHYDSPRLCIRHFDYTICQFAWDGKTVFATVGAIVGALRRHLAVAEIQPGYEMDSLRRLVKYARQGFLPCNGTLKDLAMALRRDTVNPSEQAVKSPGGGTKVLRFD